ncbi:MAG: type VI secretion protein IcmF/TssM N-terminal domain-containing protein [Polyangia bacterium]
MNALLALLRLRPVLVTLGATAGSLLVYLLLWPAFLPADKDRRGALLIVGLLALWALCEWGLLALRHYREQRTRPGQLRQLFAGALRHLIRESHGGGWMQSEAVLARPWFVLLGSGESGTARLLERAGFRRIASCMLPGEAPVCAFWLSQDAAFGSVCIEVSGSALIDTEGCEQLYRWLRRLRGAPDAVLVQVALQELWGPDEERARAAAVHLSPALHTLLRQFSTELPVHVICNQLGRLEGLTQYFRSAERRPWGFRLDRPLHSEFQASLVHERAEAIIEALWQRTSTALVQGAMAAPEVEVMLDFPREMRRMSVLLGAFVTKLCETFSADTRARLGEVFFANAEGGSQFEATRHRRLPLSRPALSQGSASTEASASYFLQGLFMRVARLGSQEAPQRAPRQMLVLWTLSALCVLLMTLASTFYARRHRGQEALRRQVFGLVARLDQLTKLQQPDPQQMQTLRSDMENFLKMDREVAQAVDRLELLRQRLVGNSTSQRSLEELDRTISEYAQCQAANHLVGPLLRYEQKDVSSRASQPLYDRLLRLLEVSDGKRRQPRLGGTSTLPTTDWFDALYAIALLQRRPGCSVTPQDSKWLSAYLRTLWPLDSEGPDKRLRDSLELRLGGLLAPYLQGGRICPLLGENVARRPVEAARRILSSGGGLLAQPGNPQGIDIAAALELELRIKSIKDRPERNYRPISLTYFNARDEVPFEATRAGCQQIMAANADQIRWLRCILPEEAASKLEDRGVGNKRLASQYMARVDTAWSGWLGRLSRRARPATGVLENDLLELGGAVGALAQDIPVLFRSLGVGDAPKGESLESCRESLRSFAPFRWAVDTEDEQGSKPAELPNLWKEYSAELGVLREQLTLLGRPTKPPPPEEVLRGTITAIQSLQRAEEKRISWLKALGTAQATGSMQWQEPLGSFGQLVQKLEDEILQALLRKGRRAVACQWGALRQQWLDIVSGTAGATGQPPAEEQRGAIRAQLIRFRDGTLGALTNNTQSCELPPFHLKEPLNVEHGQIVTNAFCRRFKEILDLTGAPAAAPAAASDQPAIAPSIIPTPDARCTQPASVLRTFLDVPELQARYVCNISQRDCQRVGPTTARRVQLQVEWASGGRSEPMPLGTLREVLSRPAPARPAGQKPSHSEQDPWRQETRYAVEITAPALCQGRTFRIYFDESAVGRTVSRPAWQDISQLDSAAQHLLESCR